MSRADKMCWAASFQQYQQFTEAEINTDKILTFSGYLSTLTEEQNINSLLVTNKW